MNAAADGKRSSGPSAGPPRRSTRPGRTLCRRLACGALLAVGAALACGDAAGPDPAGPDPDAPAAVVVHSGDGQSARTGSEAVEPVRVRVTTNSGWSASGVTVAFEVTAGGGSVPAPSAVTDDNGIASPGRWTMGEPGPQQLTATVAGLAPVIFHATALRIPAAVALAEGADQAGEVAAAVPVTPVVAVTDAEDFPVEGVVVRFVPDQGGTVGTREAVTDEQGRASPGTWTLGTAVGAQSLTATADADGLAGNPVVVTATAHAAPAARVVAVHGDGQSAEVNLPVPVAPVARIEDAYGNTRAGDTVRFAASSGGAVNPAWAVTDSSGEAAVVEWLLGFRPGEQSLEATVAGSGGVSVAGRFAATARPAVYDIEVVHVSREPLTETQLAAFERAEAYWERAVRGNLDPVRVAQASLQRCLDRNNIAHAVPAERVVDDLVIYVDVRYIDGPAAIFGGAGPCVIRNRAVLDNALPAAGIMFFDAADMEGLEEHGHLDGTILHEMAHVLGFGGNFWEHLDLLADPARAGRSANTHFRGPQAAEAFAGVGGERYTGSRLVPVQNLGGEGVWNGHWRELVLYSELMTPFIDSGPNPLSVVTLASLIDVGYKGVSLSAADDYEVPVQTGRAARGGESGALAPGGAKSRVRLVEAPVRGPIVVVNPDGSVVRRIER